MLTVPVIQIVPLGNLANRMLQYMAALRLQELVPRSIVAPVLLPEWDLDQPALPEAMPGRGILLINNAHQFDLPVLAERLNTREISGVLLKDFLQDVRFYHEPAYYRMLFQPPEREAADLPSFASDELVINIRAGEVLRGIDHYPMIPVAFYQDIIERSRLRPVIMGQLDPGPYLDSLRGAFPNARYIASQGAVRDFQMIRSATHIAPSVSTFSWLAAWLSQALTIHLPLLGFYNPGHIPEVNLLPLGDARWQLYSFPFSYGMPEVEILRFHDRTGRNWRKIPHEQVSYIISHRPFVKRRSGLRFAVVDRKWYVREYQDAALEISEGWYEDPQHHFEAAGHARGHLPCPPKAVIAPLKLEPEPAGRNLALGQPALQSSVSRWSAGATAAVDAAGAVNGSLIEAYGFHTAEEDQPWWQVDLGLTAAIEAVVVYNRIDHPMISLRATPLLVLLSDDGATWRVVHETAAGERIGGTDGRPLVWRPPGIATARYVRIKAGRRTVLHLVEVEVFGVPADSSAIA